MIIPNGEDNSEDNIERNSEDSGECSSDTACWMQRMGAVAGGSGRNGEAMRFCACCLQILPQSGYRLHLQSPVHEAHLNRLFKRATQLLRAIGDDWENCFDRGATFTKTVVIVMCSHCDGAGDRIPEWGVPGVPFKGGTSGSRFVCRQHARAAYCRSCATCLGKECFYIDPDAFVEFRVR